MYDTSTICPHFHALITGQAVWEIRLNRQATLGCHPPWVRGVGGFESSHAIKTAPGCGHLFSTSGCPNVWAGIWHRVERGNPIVIEANLRNGDKRVGGREEEGMWLCVGCTPKGQRNLEVVQNQEHCRWRTKQA